MARVIAIDYGSKRVGVAVTDELQIIASGLTTLTPKKTLIFLQEYFSKNDVEAIIIGQPKQRDGSFSNIEKLILKFITKLQKQIPNVTVIRHDERFTSKIASKVMIDNGLKKNQRRNKSLIDQISATIILQSYLEFKKHQK
jgi:putative Holliday junction resolvase